MVYALVVAGGRGRRFSGRTPKQYAELAGVPMVIRTLKVFDDCGAIDAMVLVVPADDVVHVRDGLLPEAGLTKKILLCNGGPRRQDSVFNGLSCIAEDDSVVVIHDAVRPLVTCECITACVEAARIEGAGIAAVPAWDTLKRVTGSGIIETTLPREQVWLAQTPQAFRTGLIRAAHQSARMHHFHATDDAALVEHTGGSVRIVAGSLRNVKVTTVEDLAIAEALLAERPSSIGSAQPTAA